MTAVDLAYDVHGEGPLLVLVHGITENRHSWDPVRLSDSFRVVRVDLRGHGESPGAQPYDPLTLAADVYAVVEKEGGDVPILVGHSMGGVVVTAYANRYPVRSVINVDQALALVAMQEQVQGAADLLRGDGFADVLGAMFGQLYGGLDQAEADRIAALRSPNQEVVLGMWSPLLDLTPEQLGALVQQVASLPAGTPYLSLHGTDLGPDYTAWLTSVIPSATVEVWGEVPTHYPHLVDPDRFVARVKDFTA